MLVDGGAAVSLMSYTLLCKIRKSNEDLTPIVMILVEFEGNVSPTQGAICAVRPFQSPSLSLKGGDLKIYCWAEIGYVPIMHTIYNASIYHPMYWRFI
jgi:hypothetical protein